MYSLTLFVSLILKSQGLCALSVSVSVCESFSASVYVCVCQMCSFASSGKSNHASLTLHFYDWNGQKTAYASILYLIFRLSLAVCVRMHASVCVCEVLSF